MKRVLIGSLVFVGLFNLFFYPLVLGIGLGVFATVIASYLFVVRDKESLNLKFGISLSIASVILAFISGVKAPGPWTVLDLFTAMTLMIAAGIMYKKKAKYQYGVWYLVMTPFLAIKESLTSTLRLVAENKDRKPSAGQKDLVMALLRGIVVAIPLVAVLLLLLTQADPVFQKLVGAISLPQISARAVVSVFVFVTACVWGITKLWGEMLGKKSNGFDQITGERYVIESLVVCGLIVTLFAVFLLVQFRYLFLRVPESQLASLGINIRTYSEYARQGFFQLLIAATIAGSVVAYVTQYLHNLSGLKQWWLKLSLILLTLETELLLGSAGKRLVIYGQEHGLTRSRFFGAVFLAWLATMLIILMVSVFKKIKARNNFMVISGATAIAFVVINLVPIDRLIATRYQPTVNNEIDYFYVLSLSAETAETWPSYIRTARDEWGKLTKIETPNDGEWGEIYTIQSGLRILAQKVWYLDRKYGEEKTGFIALGGEPWYPDLSYIKTQRTWQAFNLGEYRAYQTIQQNREELQSIRGLTDNINQRIEKWYGAQGESSDKR